MVWIATATHESHMFSAAGVGARTGARPVVDTDEDAVLSRGSLVVETGIPLATGPTPLMGYRRLGADPLQISIQTLPNGGISLVIDQAGMLQHATVNQSGAGRSDLIRLVYTWDCSRGFARLAVEGNEDDRPVSVEMRAPRPFRISDLRGLMRVGGDRYLADDILFTALSTRIEPVGPMPSLTGQTPVATPFGYRPVSELNRGDTVLTASGQVVPVLHRIAREVPALGSFAPVRLRRPYFGLKQDIRVAPSQRLVLSGSDVEYLFGQEAVLVPVRHLVGGSAVKCDSRGATVTYHQLLLPGHEAILSAGAAVESLYIARMRRQPQQLEASLLASLDRASLPEHASSAYPVLRAFDALILAEHRAA